MILDLGDIAPLGISITDATGAAANATSVTCTIYLPDGTNVSGTVTNTVTGQYNCDYTPTQVGRHSVKWIATGSNASAFSDEFTVRDFSFVGIVGLDEVKAHLNMSSSITSNDEELRRFIDAAHGIAENEKGIVFGRRTFTDVLDGYAQTMIKVRNPYIVSVTSLTENGVSLTQGTDFWVDFSGQFIYRTRNANLSYPVTYGYWLPGIQNISVTYVAGFTNPPAEARYAILELVGWLWDSQRGASDLTIKALPGFLIPNHIKEALGGINAPAGFA